MTCVWIRVTSGEAAGLPCPTEKACLPGCACWSSWRRAGGTPRSSARRWQCRTWRRRRTAPGGSGRRRWSRSRQTARRRSCRPSPAECWCTSCTRPSWCPHASEPDYLWWKQKGSQVFIVWWTSHSYFNAKRTPTLNMYVQTSEHTGDKNQEYDRRSSQSYLHLFMQASLHFHLCSQGFFNFLTSAASDYKVCKHVVLSDSTIKVDIVNVLIFFQKKKAWRTRSSSWNLLFRILSRNCGRQAHSTLSIKKIGPCKLGKPGKADTELKSEMTWPKRNFPEVFY